MASKVTQWIVALVFAGVMMGVVLASAAHAQDAAGSWHGAIHLPPGDHRLDVEIAGKPGAYSGTVRSPEVTDRDAPLSSVTAENGTLTFTLDSVKAKYVGHWDAATSAWVGQWS